jgi:hypothetical protein
MRRLVFPVIAACGLVMVGPSSAFADDPAPTVSVKATPGKKICKVTDTKLDELSGIVATGTGFIVIDDSTSQDGHKRVFYLDDKCKIVNQVQYSGDGPRDTEDMILSPDGKTLWIADIGDNNYDKTDGTRRDNLGLWTMPVDGSAKPVLHRVAYPQGDYHDAEALLLNGDGTPIIVTKEIGKPAYIYEPTKALEKNNAVGVPLKRVGEITISGTETPSTPLGRIGNRTVSGGAVAPGGGKVALRTYTDALEWDVSGGDVLAALKTKPRITGLPNEPGGEAITYSADGKTFDTVSDMNGDHDTANYIQSYVPATTVATVKSAAGADGSSSGKKWYSDLTIDQIMYMVGGVGALGLILVGVGVFGIVRFRKRPPTASSADLDVSPDPLAGEPETELIGVGGAPQQRSGVYGGARSAPAAGGNGVYGGSGGQRGPVYGSGGGAAAGGAGGPQYGRPAGGGGAQQQRPPQQQPARNGVYGGAQQQRPQQGGPQQGGPQQGGPQQGQSGGQGQVQRPAQGGPRPPQGGGQAPRPPQGGQRPPQGGPRPPQGGGQAPRPPQGGGQGQHPPQGGPRPPQGGGQAPRPQQTGPRPPQGPRPQQGVYGQPGARPDGQMNREARPQTRFDGPDYGRR